MLWVQDRRYIGFYAQCQGKLAALVYILSKGERHFLIFKAIIQWNTCQICVTKKVTKKPKITGMILANTVHFQLLVSWYMV
tara:strand:+ start:958 stop:1200 length:243 start_codon:yes stop_codon:yes gene_type:complete